MPESLARNLKAARKKLCFSQAQAAKEWGIPLPTLISWENEIRTPRGFTLKAITKMLDEILEQQETPSPAESKAE